MRTAILALPPLIGISLRAAGRCRHLPHRCSHPEGRRGGAHSGRAQTAPGRRGCAETPASAAAMAGFCTKSPAPASVAPSTKSMISDSGYTALPRWRGSSGAEEWPGSDVRDMRNLRAKRSLMTHADRSVGIPRSFRRLPGRVHPSVGPSPSFQQPSVPAPRKPLCRRASWRFRSIRFVFWRGGEPCRASSGPGHPGTWPHLSGAEVATIPTVEPSVRLRRAGWRGSLPPPHRASKDRGLPALGEIRPCQPAAGGLCDRSVFARDDFFPCGWFAWRDDR
jgi:hypothetical protein